MSLKPLVFMTLTLELNESLSEQSPVQLRKNALWFCDGAARALARLAASAYGLPEGACSARATSGPHGRRWEIFLDPSFKDSPAP